MYYYNLILKLLMYLVTTRYLHDLKINKGGHASLNVYF